MNLQKYHNAIIYRSFYGGRVWLGHPYEKASIDISKILDISATADILHANPAIEGRCSRHFGNE
jgi:hypothetical protein